MLDEGKGDIVAQSYFEAAFTHFHGGELQEAAACLEALQVIDPKSTHFDVEEKLMIELMRAQTIEKRLGALQISLNE